MTGPATLFGSVDFDPEAVDLFTKEPRGLRADDLLKRLESGGFLAEGGAERIESGRSLDGKKLDPIKDRRCGGVFVFDMQNSVIYVFV